MISFAWPLAGVGWHNTRLARAGFGLKFSGLPRTIRDEEGCHTLQADSLKHQFMQARVVITRLLVRGVPLQPDSLAWAGRQLKLKHHQNYLTFEFDTHGGLAPGENQYACFLEGLDHGWHFTGSRTFASYTGLSPGNYVFHLQGTHDNGYRYETETSLAFTIPPPPWKNRWAYPVYVLLFACIFLAWRLYELKRLGLKRELELEHLEAEKLKELNGIKSRFFTNISHEFRTPLTLIMGQAERMRKTITDGALTEGLDMVQRSARRLHNLINQLMSLSKLESGQIQMHVRQKNIVSMVRKYMQPFESLAEKKEIELSFHSDRENILVFTDRDKVEIILFNLLSNAFKFTANGGHIAVRLSGPAMTVEDGMEMVQLAVSDNGCGIPQDKIPWIFDRFFQADDMGVAGQEGTGIGLAIVKEFVGMHRGRISVSSAVGQGSTFTVYLRMGKDHFDPDELVKESEALSETETTAKTGRKEAGKKTHRARVSPKDNSGPAKEKARRLLLVVEDNDDLRTFISKCLQEDFRILEARHGEEGLEIATASIPDLVVSDVMMPHMDGYELCRKLKADERTSHIPIILLTVRAALEDRVEGFQTGADDFITKPFNMHELLVRVKNLIRQRERLKERYKSRYLFVRSGDQGVSTSGFSSDELFLAKARDFVTRNLSDPDLNIKQFSRHMAMSHSQLYRKLKALVDCTPSGMIRSFRLQLAAELIASRKGSISEIAYAVGFNNPSYFTECFRKQFGCLPSEYNA